MLLFIWLTLVAYHVFIVGGSAGSAINTEPRTGRTNSGSESDFEASLDPSHNLRGHSGIVTDNPGTTPSRAFKDFIRFLKKFNSERIKRARDRDSRSYIVDLDSKEVDIRGAESGKSVHVLRLVREDGVVVDVPKYLSANKDYSKKLGFVGAKSKPYRSTSDGLVDSRRLTHISKGSRNIMKLSNSSQENNGKSTFYATHENSSLRDNIFFENGKYLHIDKRKSPNVTLNNSINKIKFMGKKKREGFLNLADNTDVRMKQLRPRIQIIRLPLSKIHLDKSKHYNDSVAQFYDVYEEYEESDDESPGCENSETFTTSENSSETFTTSENSSETFTTSENSSETFTHSGKSYLQTVVGTCACAIDPVKFCATVVYRSSSEVTTPLDENSKSTARSSTSRERYTTEAVTDSRGTDRKEATISLTTDLRPSEASTASHNKTRRPSTGKSTIIENGESLTSDSSYGSTPSRKSDSDESSPTESPLTTKASKTKCPKTKARSTSMRGEESTDTSRSTTRSLDSRTTKSKTPQNGSSTRSSVDRGNSSSTSGGKSQRTTDIPSRTTPTNDLTSSAGMDDTTTKQSRRSTREPTTNRGTSSTRGKPNEQSDDVDITATVGGFKKCTCPREVNDINDEDDTGKPNAESTENTEAATNIVLDVDIDVTPSDSCHPPSSHPPIRFVFKDIGTASELLHRRPELSCLKYALRVVRPSQAPRSGSREKHPLRHFVEYPLLNEIVLTDGSHSSHAPGKAVRPGVILDLNPRLKNGITDNTSSLMNIAENLQKKIKKIENKTYKIIGEYSNAEEQAQYPKEKNLIPIKHLYHQVKFPVYYPVTYPDFSRSRNNVQKPKSEMAAVYRSTNRKADAVDGDRRGAVRTKALREHGKSFTSRVGYGWPHHVPYGPARTHKNQLRSNRDKKVFWATMTPEDGTNLIVYYVVNKNVSSLPKEIDLKIQPEGIKR